MIVLMILSIEPISVGENNKDILFPKTLTASDNNLADITMTWDSFFHRLSLDFLDPVVIINQSAVKDYYFPEVNGTIPQINFSVTCKHRLESPVLLPRFTQVYIGISYNDSFILLNESIKHRCKSLEWEYINLTVESNDQFIPLITNGQNVTLTVEVGAYSFFFGLRGVIETLDPITIHPILSPPK